MTDSARTEEIRARVEKEIVSELRFKVEVRDDEVLLRRKLHSGVSVGTPRSFTGTRVLELWNALVTSRTELTALREEVQRLKGALEEADEAMQYVLPELPQFPPPCSYSILRAAHRVVDAALSPSPAQQEQT